MKLSEIIKSTDVTSVLGPNGKASALEIQISDIQTDSRKVVEGCLFVAVRGFAADGHDFIAQALERGAVATVCEEVPSWANEGQSSNAIWITVKDSRKALGRLASAFYSDPSSRLTLVGITGTNGKTTTVTLLHRLFTSLGYKCGMLSTIANYVGDRESEAINTTSDPVTTNRLLAEMVSEGCSYCFMEVSSIGMVQDRVEGLDFNVGIFSNLTHDHLDYHKTFDEYLRCKKLFFDSLPSKAVAITNIDDRNGNIMLQNTRARKVTYALTKPADHKGKLLEQSMEGMLLDIDGTQCWSTLTGVYNAYNILAIYSTAVELGVNKTLALTKISALKGAKGRLEIIPLPGDVSVVIDYAHTPDALENVLKTIKGIKRERPLVCLFGCGGDRDKTKRPEMAAVAQKYADKIVVTSDNSRSEKTSDIIDDICKGFNAAGLAKCVCIEDREQAIRTAVMLAGNSSTVLLAGKGHETYQILGKEKKHFDEREIIENIKNLTK